MPWRLILTLIFFTLIIVFIGLNLDNKASVSFGVYVFQEIPVFVSLFVSFICGVLIMVPFTLGKRRKKQKHREVPLMDPNGAPVELVQGKGKKEKKRGRETITDSHESNE